MYSSIIGSSILPCVGSAIGYLQKYVCMTGLIEWAPAGDEFFSAQQLPNLVILVPLSSPQSIAINRISSGQKFCIPSNEHLALIDNRPHWLGIRRDRHILSNRKRIPQPCRPAHIDSVRRHLPALRSLALNPLRFILVRGVSH